MKKLFSVTIYFLAFLSLFIMPKAYAWDFSDYPQWEYDTSTEEECIVEITNEAVYAPVVYPGGTIKGKSQILNQYGETGSIPQEFIYEVVTADRTTVLEGALVTPGENGEYTVQLANNTAVGDYSVIAIAGQSTLDQLLQKGMDFTVTNTISDTDLPEIPENQASKFGFTGSNTNSSNWKNERVDGYIEQATKWTLSVAKETGERTHEIGPVVASASSGYAEEVDEYFSPNKNYVLSAWVKDASSDGLEPSDFNIYYGAWNTTRSYTNNYPTAQESMQLTKDWQKFTGTFTATEDQEGLNRFIMGVPTIVPVAAGQGFAASDFYLAEEIPYDILFDGLKIVSENIETVIDIDVVNQIGEKGKISQDISWVVTNADRTQGGSGITVTPSTDDPTIVTISVDDTVSNGTYTLLLMSNGIIKGMDFEVVSSIADTEAPEKAANIVSDPDNVNAFYRSNGGAGNVLDYKSGANFRWKEANKEPHSTYGAGPTHWTIENGSLVEGLTNGTSYVVSVNLKNDTFETKPNLDFVLAYGGKNIGARFNVNSAEYQTYTNVFTSNADTQIINIGFDTSIDRRDYTEEEFGILNIDLSNGGSIYIAKEQAHSVAITGDNQMTTAESKTIKAEMLNQIGLTGNLSQEFDWLILNSSKDCPVDAMTLTENSDGSVTVTANTCGTYEIVAVNKSTGFIKSHTMTVEAAKESISSAVFTQSGLNVNFQAAIANAVAENIFFVIAEYSGNGKVMEKVRSDSKTADDANCNLNLENVTVGNIIKAFIWNQNTQLPIDNDNNLLLEYTVVTE